MKTPRFFSWGLAVALGLLVQLTHTQAQHSDDFLVIEAEPGWSIIWDGNDGDHFDPTAPDNGPNGDQGEGGAVVPDNLALASNGAIAFGTSELDPARWDFHVIPSVNNGTYGNFSSWISAPGDEDKFVGIDLGGQFVFGRIAWGRDNGNGNWDDTENDGGDACGGQCDDRWDGAEGYTLQITTVPNPDVDTPESDWETIGTFEYIAADGIEPGEGFTPWLRHEYEIARTDGNPTVMTGMRIIVPMAGGTAIDEIEVYGPNGDPRFFFTDVNQISDRPDAQTLGVEIANRGGTKTLNIASATLTGDPAFTLTSFPATLDPFAVGEIVVAFDPQGKVGRYLGEIAVVSDDEFFPESTIPIVVQVEHANGLIAHYPMDETEGDQLVDASGNNYHGTYVRAGGAVMLGADPLASGTAVAFSGDLAYAEIPAEVGFPLMQTFSVSMWVNFDPSGEGNFSSLISKGVELGVPFATIAAVGGPLQFFSAGVEEAPTEAVITSGQAHHVVITHEDKNGPKEFGQSEVRLYLDGELVFENVESDGFDDRNPSPIQIGATAGQFGMIGSVDDVQIYQLEMTPENVVFLRDNPGDLLGELPLLIRPADGFAVDWDGNDGDHFDATAPPDGAIVNDSSGGFDNQALKIGTPFSSSDLGPELGIDFHAAHNITDGLYGNANSWISASGDENPFIGVALSRKTDLKSVAWGRDNGNGAVDDSTAGSDACGGQCDDRSGGVYTLQVTSATNPDATTPDDDWTTLGTFDYRDNADADVGGAFTTFLRHEYQVSREGADLLVTGVRLLVGGGTAVDELEIYGVTTGIPVTPADGFDIVHDGNEGVRVDGANVPDNAALASNGATPFTSGDLGPELNIAFHIVDNVNDGLYGNSNSWISGSDNETPFLGVNLGGMVDITSVAWGRDNTGQFQDRSDGVYTLQVTTAENPNVDTPDGSWTTVGTFHYDEAISVQKHLRHEFQVSQADGSPISATGVRLLVPAAGLGGGTAIDELEVNPLHVAPPVDPEVPEVPVKPAEGFDIVFDGNEGVSVDGANVPNNAALASNGATPFTSGDLGPELNIAFHIVDNVNDGLYGNSNSWISGSADDPPFLGVNLGGMVDITSVAWGRDNTGQFQDRSDGVYTLQVTTTENPNVDTPDGSWTTVGTFHYDEAISVQKHLRHEFQVSQADGSPILATGVRLLVPAAGLGGGTAIDELEVYGAPPVDIAVTWDGNNGDFFDETPPPDGALVPDNVALASNGSMPFASGELGPTIGVDFHVAANLNDGFYGNANSWIGTGGDGPFFAGVDLGGLFHITAVAWGRDNGNNPADCCGGQLRDRLQGTYILQVTTDENPDGNSLWITTAEFAVGDASLEINGVPQDGEFNGYLRHEYAVSTPAGNPVQATGVRLVVSDPSIAIDEIEVYGFTGPEITPSAGFGIGYDGNDGDFFDQTPPPDGAIVPDNLALASNGATPFASTDLGPELNIDFHVAANLNDGFFGNSNSWISASGDPNPFVGVNLGGAVAISSIAWGRDNGNGAVDDSDAGSDACGGQCDDRSTGIYTLQVTTAANPSADTPDGEWQTVGTFDYQTSIDAEVGAGFTTFLRHAYRVTQADGTPITATGIRILVPTAGLGGGTDIDELEVYGVPPHPLSVDLLSYYPFEGSLQDSAGTSHGEGMGADPIAFDAGVFGQGIDLNGVDQFVQTPEANEDLFDFGAPDNPTGFTVSAWFRVDAFTKSWQALIAKGEGNRWRIHRQGDTDGFAPVGGAGDIGQNSTSVNDGAVHHMALVSAPGVGVSYYLDGVLIETGPAPTLENNALPMMIGENPDARGRTWDGLIDDVALWSRPLTEAEVLEIANSSISLGEIINGSVPADRAPEITGVTISAAGVSLQLPAGTTYDIEFSTDLENWTQIATDVSDTYEDTDAGRTGAGSGYYRGVVK